MLPRTISIVMLIAIVSFAQTYQLTGIVRENKNGQIQPLTNARITLVDKGVTAVTDNTGRYRIFTTPIQNNPPVSHGQTIQVTKKGLTFSCQPRVLIYITVNLLLQ